MTEKTLDLSKWESQLPARILDDVRANLPKDVTSKQIEKVMELVLADYIQAQITPGECVGIIAAESIGEPGTQMTLNTKHFAGVTEMSVSTGLPRLIEILDGRQEIETPSMEVYLKKPFSEGKQLPEMARKLKQIIVEDVADNFSINIAESTVEVQLNDAKLKKYELSVDEISKVLKKSIKEGEIKVEGLLLIAKAEVNNLNEVYKTKEKIRKAFVGGVKGVEQVFPVKRGEEYIFITSGSNLKDTLEIVGVDAQRTYTNDLYETMDVLGIEATRSLVMREVQKVLETQGLAIDMRHMMLVADTMCVNGSIKGISRYGVVSEKSSVLARMSFETPLKHVINASIVGEVDYLNSVIENVMVNQPVPIGTGLPGLRVKKVEKK